MFNDFITTELREIKIFDFTKINEHTKIEYYERTTYEDVNEDWSWSYVGKGEIIDVCEDEIDFHAGGFRFCLNIDEVQDGFHKIKIIE